MTSYSAKPYVVPLTVITRNRAALVGTTFAAFTLEAVETLEGLAKATLLAIVSEVVDTPPLKMATEAIVSVELPTMPDMNVTPPLKVACDVTVSVLLAVNPLPAWRALVAKPALVALWAKSALTAVTPLAALANVTEP